MDITIYQLFGSELFQISDPELIIIENSTFRTLETCRVSELKRGVGARHPRTQGSQKEKSSVLNSAEIWNFIISNI